MEAGFDSSLVSSINILESPGLRQTILETDRSLNRSPAATLGGENLDQALGSLDKLSKPFIRQYLIPDMQELPFVFQGTAYARQPGEQHEPSPVLDTAEGMDVTLPRSELADVNYRRIGGAWRVVFSLLASHQPAGGRRVPQVIDIDPLEAGNALFPRYDQASLEAELVDGLRETADISIAKAAVLGRNRAARLEFRNNMATEADRVCKTHIWLPEYQLGLKSVRRHFGVQRSHLVEIPDRTETIPRVGEYAGMKFIDDIPGLDNIPIDLTWEEKDAPCMVLATGTNGGKRHFYYPLASLASVQLLGFRQPAENSSHRS